MARMSQKLKSQSGASIIIALLFFFVCAMVGAVIMASASANMDKASGRKDNEQQYLAMRSALAFIRETVGGVTYTAWEKEIYYTCARKGDGFAPAPENNRQEESGEMAVKETGDRKLQSLLSDLAYQMFRSQTVFCHKLPAPDSIEFIIEGENMPKVNAKLTIYANYNLSCQVTVEGSPYAATIAFAASVQAADPGSAILETLDTTCIHSWSETKFDVEQGKDITKHYSDNFPMKCKTLNTEIIWDEGTVTKGVVGGA